MDATTHVPFRMPRSIATVVALLGVAAASGCGGAATGFEPAHPSGTSATYPTTSYELRIGSSPAGSAVVWSEGVAESSAREVVDVEMMITNTTRQPIGLDVDTSSVTVVTHEGRTAPLGRPLHVGGTRRIMPDSSGRIGLHYALPSDLDVTDIAGFDFNWSVASPAGGMAQRTAFVQSELFVTHAMDDSVASCTGVYRPRFISDCIDPPSPPTLSR